MNWPLELKFFINDADDITNETKHEIEKCCDDLLLENVDMFDALVYTLQYLQENTDEKIYKESKKVIGEFYGENKKNYTDELMETAYLENAHDVVTQLSDLKELGDIDDYTEGYANDVIKDTLSFQYYPKVAMGEIRLTAFMDNELELMQLYQPAKMVFNELPEESDTMKCCMSSYEKARKSYEELKNFPMNDIPTVQLESYASNSDYDEATILFENFVYNKKNRNFQKVEKKYDLKPFPFAYVANWKMEMESVTIDNLHKFIKGFENIPAYEVVGGVHSVSKNSEEWKMIKKAVLSYMNAGRHSDCVAVGNLDIKTDNGRITLGVPEKNDKNDKAVDNSKIGLDAKSNQKTLVKTYRRNGQPFFAYAQIGEASSKADAWILYKDTIAKRHCMYYMAHALCSLNLSSSTVVAWAKKQLQEFDSMKNPYDKDGKTVIAKESDDSALKAIPEKLNDLSKELNTSDMDKVSNDIEKSVNTISSANEATSVGTMLPQIPVTNDTDTRDETASLYVPEGNTRPDTKYIRWDDDMYGTADMYKIDKSTNIIDASRTPLVQEAVKYAQEILRNISSDKTERELQKRAYMEYVNTIIDAVNDKKNYDMLVFDESAMDALNFYFEKCYVDDTGDFVDVYEFTTAIADNLLKEKTDIPSFYATEAANTDLDMQGIVKILNEKGYKVKYSCGGHPASPKKEDRNRNNVYYGKLYTTARIVFDGKYKFQDSPKGWHFNPTTEKNTPPRTSLYADEITYDDKKGSGNQAFLSWKNKYMSALRTWVSQIPDADKMKSRATDAVAAKISDSANDKSQDEIKKESVDTIGLDNPNEDYKDFIESVNNIFKGENPFNR